MVGDMLFRVFKSSRCQILNLFQTIGKYQAEVRHLSALHKLCPMIPLGLSASADCKYDGSPPCGANNIKINIT